MCICRHRMSGKINVILAEQGKSEGMTLLRIGATSYEGDSIYNEIALITPPTHGLELYTIYGMKDQGFTFRMVHRTLFYHFYSSSYRL